MAQADDIAAVLDLETRRIAAVNRGDADAIEPLLADDIIQVHGNGRIDNKTTLMEIERAARRTIEPRDPLVRLFGDIAIITGPAIHHAVTDGAPVTYRLFTTQVAARKNGQWQFVSVQATLIP